MPSYRLTVRAELDLGNIADYTLAEFGAEQCRAYAALLARAFGTIAEYPNIGRDFGDVVAGLRRFSLRRHAVYYSVDDDGVVIERVLHHAQDPMSQF